MWTAWTSLERRRRREVAVTVVTLLLIVAHAATTRLLPPPSNPAMRDDARALEMHVLQEQQREHDAEALRRAVAANTSLAPEVRARLDERARATQCYAERDYGMVPALRHDFRAMCTNATGVDAALGALSAYQYFDSPQTGLTAALVTNLWVDLRNAEIFKPIQDIAHDGHLHDPRFKHRSVQSYCVCNQDQDHSLETSAPVWRTVHGEHDAEKWQYCKAIQTPAEVDALRAGFTAQPWKKTRGKKRANDSPPPQPPHPHGWPYPVHYVTSNAIIVGRSDDHNPFFQISSAMNAWIMLKVLNWSVETTQLVYFDDAIPAKTDELQRRMLAPVLPAVQGREIIGSVLRFDHALIAPSEYDGPMMRHLNDDEPCRENTLVKDFRELAMDKFGVALEKQDPASCTITVITRRPYQGRNVQRKWLNEDTILDRMRADYKDIYKYGTCRFRSLEFVDLTLDQQMRAIVESDVVIGMHGAGMVNVLWARPETHITEIFPKRRFRWGYRNLCQFVGCKWSQFRGGVDTGSGDNASDKLISYGEWFGFFDPIIRQAVADLEARVAQRSWR